MLRQRFLLLVLLSVSDAWLTVAEAGRAGLPVEGIEANPVMRAVLEAWGAPGMVAAKLLPLAALGMLLVRQPMPRVVRALVGIFGALMVYHAALWVG